MAQSSDETGGLDDAIVRLLGVPQYISDAGTPANIVNNRAMCAATENANSAYWDGEAASEMLGAPYCPSTMLPAWGRPELWEPGQETRLKALQAHFDLKELLGYSASMAVSYATSFYLPVKIGDRFKTQQVLRSVSAIKKTKLAAGRFWVIDMQYLNDDGELVGVESYEFFGFEKGAS